MSMIGKRRCYQLRNERLCIRGLPPFCASTWNWWKWGGLRGKMGLECPSGAEQFARKRDSLLMNNWANMGQERKRPSRWTVEVYLEIILPKVASNVESISYGTWGVHRLWWTRPFPLAELCSISTPKVYIECETRCSHHQTDKSWAVLGTLFFYTVCSVHPVAWFFCS